MPTALRPARVQNRRAWLARPAHFSGKSCAALPRRHLRAPYRFAHGFSTGLGLGDGDKWSKWNEPG
ncbi:hypothetical protein [Ottowia massiliensis]|uniref:hypothetical protein n=1 Tax=Ottowia massiliensis TaxID=2045302 RepID=UPI0011AF8D76|nr:hypothetical protein [Ottowia massiliensis]